MKVIESVKKGEAKKLNIYTKDHQQLDACVVYADKDNPQVSDKKMMVMVQGNLTSYEQAFSEAQAYAKKYGVNVLIYNPRGVGESLGKEYGTKDAVEDCKSVIKYAKDQGIDPKNLGVLGQSLGGGVSSTALKELIQEGDLPKDGVGLYINKHSFSSLHGFALGFANSKSPLLLAIVKTCLTLIGFNTLNTHDNITNYQLANKVVVLTAEDDEVMTGIGKASESLQNDPKAKLKETASKLQFINVKGVTHNTDEEYVTSTNSNQIAEMNEKIAASDALIIRKTEAITSLEREITEHSAGINHNDSLMTELKKEITELESANIELKKSESENQGQIEKNNRFIDARQTEIKEFEKKNQNLKTDIKESEKAIKDSRVNIGKAKLDINRCTGTIKRLLETEQLSKEYHNTLQDWSNPQQATAGLKTKSDTYTTQRPSQA